MAAQALASAAYQEGGYATAFPFFGAERRGAPVLAFTRIDKKRIYRKTQVLEPDFVVVLDETLLDTINVVEGLKKGGMVIVNSAKKPEERYQEPREFEADLRAVFEELARKTSRRGVIQ